MSKRTEISQVAPQDVGLPGTSSLTNAMVQELFNAAKSFKVQHEFIFCWTKSGAVNLRRSEGSRPIKIKDFDYHQENLE